MILEVEYVNQMISIDVNIIMVVLIVFMLFTITKWNRGYSFQSFWIVAIIWFGGVSLANDKGNISFLIICMVFAIMVNVFALEVNLHKRT